MDPARASTSCTMSDTIQPPCVFARAAAPPEAAALGVRRGGTPSGCRGLSVPATAPQRRAGPPEAMGANPAIRGAGGAAPGGTDEDALTRTGYRHRYGPPRST